LLRYYELRGDVAEHAAESHTDRRDRTWLEPLVARVVEADSPVEVQVKVQGLRCAACVWLIQELFRRLPSGLRIIVNPGRGTLTLAVGAGFPLAAFVEELESFGYQLGPHAVVEASAHDELLVRTGVCLALGGNAMMFAAAIYLGLADGPLYRLLHTLNFACASLAVLIGAPVFMRSAWQALRARILHLDLPIAVGIALTYTAAVWSFTTGNTRAAYYDSLAAFIGLMLLGRWLKERIVVRNQRALLEDDGIDNLLARRVEGDTIALVRCHALKAGDVLLIPPGDLVPVSCELSSTRASCSLDWINGESEPRVFQRGQALPAGAFNAGRGALHAIARTGFADSELVQLMSRSTARELATPRRYHVFSASYVLGVLGAALIGFAYWTVETGDVVRGLEVATAICVVTCPCAIGVAAPLAYDLVLSGLRRAGLFVRTPTFLDRALEIRRVVFDKTGTLTTGRLELERDEPLRALEPAARDALYTLVTGSVHPKSLAVQRALARLDAKLTAADEPTEQPGLGIEAHIGGRHYRLGRGAWVLGSEQLRAPDASDLVFGADGDALCELRTCESMRTDAQAELERLAHAGYETWILSGDQPSRVREMAGALGVPLERALGGFSPEAKASWIDRNDRGDMLMIGDGINDGMAVQRAFSSGTPAIDRAFMPWRTDFYFVTPGLAPIGLALRAARRLARVVQSNQVFAVAYNLGVVGLALAGLMKPWLAAVLMPLSSVVVLSATSFALSSRSRLWRS
jgi:Cu2+-exporting ATPase